ncbi:hypothetical protein ACI1MP_37510 (plasmid) [Kitasatospora griseola]|uniref:hypothetical protein n=1 Tax=Kitasatospora griseola TaxID=2064 RepID=UPI003855D7E1
MSTPAGAGGTLHSFGVSSPLDELEDRSCLFALYAQAREHLAASATCGTRGEITYHFTTDTVFGTVTDYRQLTYLEVEFTMDRIIVWGRWRPVAGDTDGLEAAPLEWWPSHAALEQRLALRAPHTSRCRVNRADGTSVEDAQFYGSEESRIYLYEVDGAPGTRLAAEQEPYAVVEFGPCGGIRRSALTRARAGR